jgi:hypothetical protein
LILTEDKRNVTVSGLKSTKMQVAVDAQTIKNLIANYSRPYESCIRELCVNAFESHLLAGKPDVPFDIHMPTKLESWFSIRDRGIGMSENEIHELYSVIGKSSKRGSNDLPGAFGVGSKAAYAVTNIFTIQSTYNGKIFSYICHLDSDGIPCVSEAPNNGKDTTDENGFTVKFDVPSSEYYKFKDALKPALAFFKVKPNISGCVVDWLTTEAIVEGKKYKVYKSQGYNKDKSYVIMGQIGYPIDTYNIGYGKIPTYGFEIEVPIGAVDINSSRETLQYSSKTVAAIDEACSNMKADIESKIDGWIAKEDCGWNKGIKSEEFRLLFGTKTRYPPQFLDSSKLELRFFGFGGGSLRLDEIKTIKNYTDRSGIRFVIDDLPRGAISRCNEIGSGHGLVALIPKGSRSIAKTQLGILDKHIIKASELPKPQITRSGRSSTGVSKSKVQILNRNTTRITRSWKDADGTLIKGVYCDISRHRTTLNGKEYSPLEIGEILNFIEKYEPVPIVYGIKKGGTPDKTWTPLEDFVNEKVKKHIQEYINAVNAPYISKYDYNILEEILDFSSFPFVQRERDCYTVLLSGWFKVPDPILGDDLWGRLMNEMFFWELFKHRLHDQKYIDAFKILCKQYITTFKLKDSK